MTTISVINQKILNEKLTNQIPIQIPNQIIIQGNRRLENELILRSSGIEKNWN